MLSQVRRRVAKEVESASEIIFPKEQAPLHQHSLAKVICHIVLSSLPFLFTVSDPISRLFKKTAVDCNGDGLWFVLMLRNRNDLGRCQNAMVGGHGHKKPNMPLSS
jgi:hypothetical protein